MRNLLLVYLCSFFFILIGFMGCKKQNEENSLIDSIFIQINSQAEKKIRRNGFLTASVGDTLNLIKVHGKVVEVNPEIQVEAYIREQGKVRYKKGLFTEAPEKDYRKGKTIGIFPKKSYWIMNPGCEQIIVVLIAYSKNGKNKILDRLYIDIGT